MRTRAQTIDIRIEDREDGPVTVSVRCTPDLDWPNYWDTEVLRAQGDDGKNVVLTVREEYYAAQTAVDKASRD